MSLAEFESPAWPVCTLSYRMFHLQWTLPLCLALFLLNRPFLTRLDYAKLTLLPIIAFIWTTPWDNLIVKNHAWFYRRHCIWFTVGYVPIEEYFFFIIQSVMTTLWCSFVTRWRLPNLYTCRGSKPRLALATPAVAVAIGCFTAGLWASQPDSSSYYFGMITWWSSVPLGLLMWGAIDFVAAMGFWAGHVPFLISITVPTVYLWCSDIYALRRGTWHINERTSLRVFPIKDLPVEEMLFFVVTNTILVTACFTFDRCVAICRSNTPMDRTALSPSFLPLNAFTTYKQLWLAFVQSDDSISRPTQDLQLSLQVLRKASKSFSAASLLLPWDLRTDLGCLYAFCRVADDLVDDDTLDLTAKQRNLQTVRAVIDTIYDKERANDPVRRRIEQVLAKCSISPDIQVSVCAAACSIAPLVPFVPKRLWLEMLSGYSSDLNFEHPDHTLKTRFKTMSDLVEYSQCVAGVVGEMCTRLILARCGVQVDKDLKVDRTIRVPIGNAASPEKTIKRKALDLSNSKDVHTLLYEARRMGVSLQLVNIARDIIPDSIELGRCYLPLDLFAAEDRGLQAALLDKQIILQADQRGVHPAAVRKYALQLLDISKSLYEQAFPALDHIPNRPARAGLRAACSVYAAIGTRIEAQTASEVASGKRARMSSLDRLARALSAVYLGSC